MPTQISKQWVTAVKRKHTPLFVDILQQGQNLHLVNSNTGFPLEFTKILDQISPRRNRLAYDADEVKKNREIIRDQVKTNGLLVFKQFANRCYKSANTLIKVSEESANLEDSFEAIESYFVAAINHATFLQTMILTQFELENFINLRLEDTIERDPDFLSSVSIPSQDTHEVLNSVDLLKLIISLKEQNPEILGFIRNNRAVTIISRLPTLSLEVWNEIEIYRKNYAWMGRMYYDGEPWSTFDVILRIKNFLEGDARKVMQKYQGQKIASAKKKKNALQSAKEFCKGNEIDELVGTLAQYLHLRTYRLDAFFIAHENMMNHIDNLCQNLGIKYSYFIFSTIDEIKRLSKDKHLRKEFMETASARSHGFRVLKQGSTVEWALMHQAEEGDFGHNKKPKVITGKPVTGGKVRAKAKLVFSEQDAEQMEFGEILVTTMTMPNLMLAVEKAAGIVTDEGGILCHAAIVSREFNIPCVIDTDHATLSIQDGEKLELDANKGEIRIIT